MTLSERIRRMFGFPSRESANVTQALAMTREVGRKADDLNERLRPYREAKDPFTAMMADIYTNHQIHEAAVADIARARRKR